MSGASISVVVIRDNKVCVGHLGDTKVILGRRSSRTRSISLYPLTTDHVPTVPEEKKRIYESGGEVRKLLNSDEEKIFVRGRFFPCLSTTRSMGDDVGKLIGVISRPEIVTYQTTRGSDVFIMIGTDSLFAQLEDSEILNVLNFADASEVSSSTETLVKKAKSGWIQANRNYNDITLALCYL